MSKASEPNMGFAGSVPDLYDTYLVPMIFKYYARDLAHRVSATGAQRVLEVAAGTGAVTRSMAALLPESVSITATDLSQPMIDRAMTIGTSRPVCWQTADAMALPFDDASFDAVVCQFGAMFFPDRAAAYAEVARVLQPNGTFLFNVWDRIEHNEFANVISLALTEEFDDDPPTFMTRIPHGYFDRNELCSDLSRGGLGNVVSFERVVARSVAASPEVVALAYCQGTPIRNEIMARDPSHLDKVTKIAAAAIREEFGAGEVDGTVSAYVIGAKAT